MAEPKTLEAILHRYPPARDDPGRISTTGLFEKVPGKGARPVVPPPEPAPNNGSLLEQAGENAPLVASVRIDVNGEVVSQHGRVDALAPLVAYVTRMGALLSSQLGLRSFEAISADLGPHRALVFVDGKEMVGLLLAPSALFTELRQQLGV